MPKGMLDWLDGMRESFGRVKLKHVKTDTYEAGSDMTRGFESNTDVARRVLDEYEFSKTMDER